MTLHRLGFKEETDVKLYNIILFLFFWISFLLDLHSVPVGRVLFEVGGGRIQKELAFAALQHAKPRLPVKTEFIDRDSKARLGNILVDKPSNQKWSSSAISEASNRPLAVIERMLNAVREARA